METSIKKIIHKISGKDITKTEDLIAVEKRLLVLFAAAGLTFIHTITGL